MARHFARIAFTPGVRACQRQYGGGDLGEATGPDVAPPGAELGPREQAFVAARDSFYIATVSETGWPHVQHRGGPAGFLRVLSPNTLAFADLSGNRQYVTVGNLSSNPRVALILMDYPGRRRLKILGEIERVDPAAPPPKGWTPPEFPGGRVERILLIHLAAFDWNCSQHITPRYTENEWPQLAPPSPLRPTPRSKP